MSCSHSFLLNSIGLNVSVFAGFFFYYLSLFYFFCRHFIYIFHSHHIPKCVFRCVFCCQHFTFVEIAKHLWVTIKELQKNFKYFTWFYIIFIKTVSHFLGQTIEMLFAMRLVLSMYVIRITNATYRINREKEYFFFTKKRIFRNFYASHFKLIINRMQCIISNEQRNFVVDAGFNLHAANMMDSNKRAKKKNKTSAFCFVDYCYY